MPSFPPFSFDKKGPGELIKANEWNELMDQIVARVQKAGDIMTGPLTIQFHSVDGIDGTHLRIVETQQNSGFARLSFSNLNVPGQAWHIAGLISSKKGESVLNFWNSDTVVDSVYGEGPVGDVLSLHSTGNVEIKNNLEVKGEFIRVNGKGDEQAYIGGDGYGKDVQIGSLKAGVQVITAWNPASQKHMDFVTGGLTVNGDLHVVGDTYMENKYLYFGVKARQMINLYGTDYGIGVQDYTQYFRSFKNFAWFKGGIHHDGGGNAGGGTNLMSLNEAGNLMVFGDLEVVKDTYMKTRYLYFGTTTRQMINLYGIEYGIGVQSGTQYYRTGYDFAWFKGGGHHDGRGNAGGGTTLMKLNEAGDLAVLGNLEVGRNSPSGGMQVYAMNKRAMAVTTAGDLILSYWTNPTADQNLSRCRALVDGNQKLVLNYDNDFKNGVLIQSDLQVAGKLTISTVPIVNSIATDPLYPLPNNPWRTMKWLSGGGVGAGLVAYENSSQKYKLDITPLKDDFKQILKAQPCTYKRHANSGYREIGFIAEEFDTLGLNKLVFYDREGLPDGLDYEKICLYLLEVLRDHEARLNPDSPYLKRDTENARFAAAPTVPAARSSKKKK